jgi:hypothetical protein
MTLVETFGPALRTANATASSGEPFGLAPITLNATIANLSPGEHPIIGRILVLLVRTRRESCYVDILAVA